MARGKHSPACARRWREQAGARQWTLWQTAQAIHGCCGASLLKAHRLARGWSARQAIEELESLCERESLGLPRASIDLLNAWENNRARPRPQTIDLLARLYRANAVRLGLAADYCEDPGGQRVIVVSHARGDEPMRLDELMADLMADDAERRALFHQAMLLSLPDGRFFAEVEGTRHDLDRTLAAGSVTEDQLDRLDELVLRYRREYMITPPLPMLCRVMLEISDVRRLSAARQPFSVQRRLLTATTMLALLTADALMKLGDTRQAHAWYGTARAASDDVGDLRLRALVRAQQTMLLYYYGDPGETVRLAREARMLAGSAPSSPAALAAAAEARALARMGDGKGARTALAEAEQIFARMRGITQDDLAFVFTEKRMKFYRTGTLIELGDARQIQGIDAYPPGFHTIDPALILLDQATHLARQGDQEEACRIAAQALGQVPAEHRTSIVVTRATALLSEVDPGLPAVRHLRSVLAESSPRLPMDTRP
ncbi:helix-turn-helix domain-containing protein [Sphaerimonospora cavernae]|uniref:Helix-turn-helix domain-containing protein n=1 Tax=Sphaerimonospora cavernae TaxID=1740611 RepID=A0ABV6U4A2_9ACTN